MKRVVIESPFRADTAAALRQNIAYVRRCLLDSLQRNEAPYASHALYTQVYAETPALRSAGIAAGLEWQRQAELVVFYADLGWTEGMARAREACRDVVMTETRVLFPGWSPYQVRAELSGDRVDVWPALEALERA